MNDNRPTPELLLEQIKLEETKQNQGKLKIFFGYAAGVGKTYSMLKAAHVAKDAGIDVVIGYIEPHPRPETLELTNGLEQLPLHILHHNHLTLKEFNLNAALERNPKLILVDELAHTNVPGCRHLKRYQDVKELLKAGIDVYTTLNVQHIESLNDLVAMITGILVKERIPDAVLEMADQIELIDIEPDDLIERISKRKIYKKHQAQKALSHFFIKENLIALREIALRRTAEHIHIKAKKEDPLLLKQVGLAGEHIMVCLSPSPSNTKVIRTAARMCNAFHSSFTALFVETPEFSRLSTESKTSLRSHMKLAEKLGAKVVTLYSDDIATQIGEYAKASGVSKIVVGHSNYTRMNWRFKPHLVEKLTQLTSSIDIYVIPEQSTPSKQLNFSHLSTPKLSLQDVLKSLGLLAGSTVIGFWFFSLGFGEANIITVYILGVLFTSLVTQGKFYSLSSSLLSVLVFNFFFTEPRFSLEAYDPGYPITFLIMFLASFITSTLTVRIKKHARDSARKAYHTEVLLDTTKKLQFAKSKDAILKEMAQQLIKLLDCSVIIYPVTNQVLEAPCPFLKEGEHLDLASYFSTSEKTVAQWVFKNSKQAGATTNTLSHAKCLYLAVRNHADVFAVIGIPTNSSSPIGTFQKNLLIGLLNECSLALEKHQLYETKKQVELHAKQEQLRANLLRSISHDLRTPLTSIFGSANVLVTCANELTEANKMQLYEAIQDDSEWLITLVENLLSITRIENNSMSLRTEPELLEDIIYEALSHVSHKKKLYPLEINLKDDFLMAHIDARLIMQVIINLVNNAIQYTPTGTKIMISAYKENAFIVCEVSDQGNGIPPTKKEHLFDMFFTSDHSQGDHRRGLGLGLSLCKSIIEAHHGIIGVKSNSPQGSIFYFTLPAVEVPYE